MFSESLANTEDFTKDHVIFYNNKNMTLPKLNINESSFISNLNLTRIKYNNNITKYLKRDYPKFLNPLNNE
jgi:hypothetical protein